MNTEALLTISEALSRTSPGAKTMEAVAQEITKHLYDNLRSEVGDSRSSVLVRLYKTHAYAQLPTTLRNFVDEALGGEPPGEDVKCLTLLGTTGMESEWNYRTKSVGHQAIPLVDAETIQKIPMVARLVEEFGIDTNIILKPESGLVLNLEQKKYQVFHVAEAEGSPYIPAQKDFVRPYHVRSVVGFGGLLPSRDFFAVILFSREKIERSLAEDFSLLVLPVKIALLPFVFGEVFSAAEV